MDLSRYLEEARSAIDRELDRLTTPEGDAPPLIVEAARYALLGKGKRLRPILVLASGEATGGRREDLLPAACSLEMVHAFSLVHDDLPALDDDELRRGRPTLHVQFDEATAVLAGDALLNLAFQVMARCPDSAVPAERKLQAIGELGQAVGISGMIGGQVLDLEFEHKSASAAELERIHGMKTGALITASCRIGGILAGAGPEAMAALTAYGSALGLAFQITDDILDQCGTAEEIGKSPGKDARAEKATFPGIHGLEASRRMAAENVARAEEALAPLGEGTAPLVQIARSVKDRRR